MSVTVATQQELDAALAANEPVIYIASPADVWLRLSSTGSSRVVALGSSHVVALGSSHVVAWDSSRVVALDSSRVVALSSSHVVAWDSSRVVALGSSHVEARDSSHVEARDSSHVVAWDSSRVEALGSSHVEALSSSHVKARDSSHVVAWDSSHVEACRFVAVHLHSPDAQVEGGVIIDMTALDTTDPHTWCDLYGVRVIDGAATLYKALDADLNAGHGHRLTTYAVGSTVECEDWRDDHDCGGGLHLSPSPAMASSFRLDAVRWVQVEALVSELRPIGDKCKVRSCRVVAEVDRQGQAVAA